MKRLLKQTLGILAQVRSLGSRPLLSLTLTLGMFGLVHVPAAHAAGSVLDIILSPLSAILMMLGGAAVGIAGVMLNYSVDFFIVQMGQMLSGSDGVTEAWSMVRDVVNLTFVFGLVYVGIMTIVKGESSQTREWLVRIIIGALLVNFSLFFAKVIVDISNVAAIEIYNFENAFAGTDNINSGLSGAFMQKIGLQGALQEINWDQGDGNGATPPPFLQAVVFMFLCLVAAFVFGAAAILLAIRFAVIVLLLVLSPVMFIAPFLPVAGGWAKAWWNAMISQSLFAPAFLFTSWVSLQVLNMIPQINVAGTAGGGSDITAGNADAILSSGMSLTMTYYAISMVMLVTGIIIAKKMGAYGASSAISLGRMGAGRLGNYTLGLAGNRLRKGFERTSAHLRDNPGANKFTKGMNLAARGLSRAGGAAAGVAEKQKFGGTRSYTDLQKSSEERKRTLDRASRENKQTSAVSRLLTPGTVPAQADLDAIQNMSLNELKELGADQVAKLAAAGHLTGDQLKKIADSKDEDFSPGDRTSVSDAHAKHHRDKIIDAAGGIDPAKVAALSSDAISKLPKPVLQEIIRAPGGAPLSMLVQGLSAANLKKMVKDGISDADRGLVASQIEALTPTPWARPPGNRSSWSAVERARDWLESPAGEGFTP